MNETETVLRQAQSCAQAIVECFRGVFCQASPKETLQFAKIKTAMAESLKRVVGLAEERGVELLALLLLIPMLQSGLQQSSLGDPAPVKLEAAEVSFLASVPSVREEAGSFLIEPPENSKLTMRVVRLAPLANSRGPASVAVKPPEAARDIYTVIVSAP